MKFKLVEYPYGKELGFKQDIVWFIQGTDDNKTWNNYVWRNSPSIVYEKEVYHRPPIAAYLTIEEANEAFDKIIDYYKKQTDEKPISILREVEVQNMTFEKHQSVYVLKYINKYFKIASYANSPYDYLTDDVSEATKYPFKQSVENLIKRYKNLNPKYGTEFFLKEIISNAEIKNLVIDLKGYVDDQ